MQSNATLAFLNRTRLQAAVLIGCLLSFFAVNAQQPAFPGAEGAGRYASGGRGTASTMSTVYEVTNLNDDNNPGSLRYALQVSQATAPYRTIVFRVGGTIHLNSPLSIRSNVTLAGQTAPGGGICVADHPVLIAGNNIIVRHLRFRLGDKNSAANNGNDDALGTNGNSYKNVIIDHCSVSWSADEALSIYSGDSTTLQWNFITEPLNYSYHNEGSGVENHGYGGIQGGKKVSIHHNLYAHCYSRTPRFDGVRNLSPNTPGLENVDFVNNVIYNWGTNNVYGGEGGNYNIVNNYYKYGPSTNNGVKFRVANPYKQNSGPAIPYGKYFINGNYVDGSATNTANNWRGVTMDGGTAADTALAKVTTAFNILPVTTQDAATAYSLVLQQAGATLPVRDTLDQRIVSDVMNRTGRIIDVQGGYPHNTAYAATVNAWPTLPAGTPATDTDHDGMPDSWENSNGLNANDASDRGAFAANGYTNLENYLNSITTNPSFSVSGNLTGFAQTVGSPSAFKTYNLTGANLTSSVSINAPVNFQVSADATTWGSTATIPVVNNNLATSTVYVRMNAAAAGTYSGTISNTTSSITQTINADGIAVTAPTGVNATVAKDGSGNYATVQAAIDAAPTNSATPWVIYIKNGKYREKITVPSNKPFIQLVGESVANVILYYDDPAVTLGTSGSASVTINATDFSALNITFANYYGDGSQAVAILVNNDRASFKNCRFLGNQDTLYIKGAGNPRAYFNKCYVDGNIDFIFGSAIAVFDSCTIFPKARTVAGNSFITAANTPAGQNYGLVFRNTRIANNGFTTYFLGRPWQNSNTSTPQLLNNRTTFLNTTMGYSIAPEGWTIWDASTITSGIDYGEYLSKDFTGAAVNTSSRVPWSQQLSASQAANYTNANMFGSWDPCAVSAQMCSYQPSPIAVSNFRATKGATTGSLDWNISWNIPGITYELYRSTTRNGGYSVVNTVTNPNDTLYYFNYTEPLPTSGTAYYYYVIASRAGYASHTTDTVSISNVQTITVAGTLNAFSQNVGSPSAAQTVTISGANLTDDLTITPPANYEISNNGATWYTTSNPLVLPQVSGAVAATPISVRLNSPSLGTWAGDIVLSSPGATSVNVPVTGVTSIIVPVTQQVLQWWPMTQNNVDSAGARSIAVTASTTTFSKFTVANGSTPVAVQPYSPARGQAISASATGDGLWSTAGGGPGGSLNRTFYEQFTVTAKAGYSLRIDSLLITTAFYGTSSGTSFGIVFSKNGFTAPADSTDINLPGTGGFANRILLTANQNNGPTDVYRLAFSGATGVTIPAGQTLYFRIYYSCSSSTNAKYAQLKDVKVIGVPTDLSVPAPSISANPTSLTAFTQTLGIPSAEQTYTVSGTDLTSPLLVLPPANYEVSLDGITWNNSVTPIVLQPAAGTVAATTIHVRLNAASVGTFGGNVRNTIATGTTINVAVTGTTAAIPTILATSTMGAFSQTLGSPSATQTYTVRGLNLTTDLTITPPANFEVSADGGATWFSSASPLVLAPVSGNVAATTITVRLNAPVSGTYSGNIVHASGAATAVNVPVNGITSGTPTVISNGALSNFSQTVGTPSAVQTYTVSGSALSSNVIVTPPAGFEVSADGGATWFNAATPLQLVPASGTLATTTISVRLNASAAGTYGGDISHASTGATSINVPVNGVAVIPPSITVTASLTNFAQIVGTPSAVQTYTIAGANLVSNITIAPPAGYEVSADGTNWFSSTNALVLTPSTGTIATTTISVRLNSATAGTFAGNISHSGTGFTTVNVPVTGSAVLPPTVTVSSTALSAFAQTIGNPSTTQSYNVSGQNLTSAITVTAPANYQVSLDGTTWSNSVTVAPVSGVVSATQVFVRLNATTPGTYGGSISNVSTGATTRNVTVNGTAVAPPSLTASVTTLQPFLQQLGTPSAVQTYELTGNSLIGTTTITAPAGYQISIDTGTTWSFQPIIVTGTGGIVKVSVRLNAGTVGTYNGVISHSTAGAATVNVAVTGITSGQAFASYSLYPVPSFNQIYFVHPSDHRAATITIFTVGGQRLQTMAATMGASETLIRITTLPQGIYFAVYDDGTQRITQRFVKK
ncbi:MAG: T9SS type A sorting domain-containing protein [Chitinophagaceae bacterium]|nr:MAG: T9SS type A sorting domain-containing protein [Chitinophagaceae bacterium]